ncbi:SpoIIE family protein phosphatase [Streptomyces millisiae]|uniref:SpoIIE family protein phosphatase n=1 Tax=Streptomyces millisiae TaxID=3075542 RepID=A0ABU2LVQ2_9ACTN|nr:SpoIIE family protein phosphatase [Streptomyces sp. DSM 44918]MDT0321662.1 SpoIIE family protein phosphatase [Streptomyces sp. DSM 44918]
MGEYGEVGSGLLDAAVSRGARETGASVVLVYVLPPDGTALRLAVLSGVSPRIAAPWVRVPLSAPIPVADAVRERRLVWLGNREEMARRYPRPALVLPYDFALAAAPVTDGSTVWGGLVLLWPGSHPPRLTAGERGAVLDCCHHLAELLRQSAALGRPFTPEPRPRLVARPRPTGAVPGPDQATAAVELIERLPGGVCALDLDGRFTYVSGMAAELLGRSAQRLLGTLPWEALPWLDDPAFEERHRAALISGQPTRVTLLRPPDTWLSFGFHPDPTGITVRVTPAVPDPAVRAEWRRRPTPPAGTSEATALYNLMHLAATLTEAVDVRDVVDQADDQIMSAFGAQAIVLMTVEEGRLRITGYHGYPAELMARFDNVPLTSGTPAVRTLTSGVPHFYSTFAELKRDYRGAVHQDDKAAWAFLPLVTSDHVIGSLLLAYDSPRVFPPQERAVLSSAAGLVAQALDRARLYDARNRLALRLQSALLPPTLPHVPGLDVAARYVPALRGMGIGGDFYDLIRLDGAVAATIGDVQGHDVDAAAIMGQVRTAVHATAGAPPGEVLARTNRLLTDLDAGLFTSCLYAQLDLGRHRVQLATAGHLPPLLRHPDGRTETLDVPPGLLLGIDAHAEYPTVELPLAPGTVLALFTDGLVEAPGVDLDDATLALAGQLAQDGDHTMESLADRLVSHAERSAPRGDDIALLLIRAGRPPH